MSVFSVILAWCLHFPDCCTVVPLETQNPLVKETWRSGETCAPRLGRCSVKALCSALWGALAGFGAPAERRAAAGGGQHEDAAGGHQRPVGSRWTGWKAPGCLSAHGSYSWEVSQTQGFALLLIKRPSVPRCGVRRWLWCRPASNTWGSSRWRFSEPWGRDRATRSTGEITASLLKVLKGTRSRRAATTHMLISIYALNYR